MAVPKYGRADLFRCMVTAIELSHQLHRLLEFCIERRIFRVGIENQFPRPHSFQYIHTIHIFYKAKLHRPHLPVSIWITESITRITDFPTLCRSEWKDSLRLDHTPVMDRIYPSIRKHRKPAIFDSLSHSGFFSSKTPKNHPIRQNYLRWTHKMIFWNTNCLYFFNRN